MLILTIVDEERIIEDVQDDLIALLQSPSYTDMTAANQAISDAAGESICVITFLQCSLDETNVCKMPDQFEMIKHQIDSIICHNTTKKQATQIATSLTTWYEDVILAHAKKEQAADDYSTATQDIQL
ncbi:MAG: hypothetical protein ACPH3C_08115 [Glaciecola sp.]